MRSQTKWGLAFIILGFLLLLLFAPHVVIFCSLDCNWFGVDLYLGIEKRSLKNHEVILWKKSS